MAQICNVWQYSDHGPGSGWQGFFVSCSDVLYACMKKAGSSHVAASSV